MSVVLVVLVALTAQAGPGEPLELLPLESPSATTSTQPAPAAAAAPADTFVPGTEAFVEATSLALRAEPNRGGMLIHYMPHGARVRVVQGEQPPVPDTINGVQGYWVYVQHATQYGWTFDKFLSGAPAEMEQNLDWVAVPGVRVGPIKANTTLEQLQATFGSANVGEAKIPVESGFEPGAVIFADSPERRLFIRWSYPNKSIQSVIVEGTRWKTPAGIGIGTRLGDIVRANGAPISFAGFEWDYSGYIISWNNGLLERDHKLGEGLYIYLAPNPPYLPADYQALVGDKEFSSEMPEANKLNIGVRAMTILMKN